MKDAQEASIVRLRAGPCLKAKAKKMRNVSW
jgi:hypothetical protein